jgi:small nuclear ribonucleoprotein D3
MFVFFISAVGVPIKLLHEAEGHVVTVELKTGEAYRGLLEESEDTMNCRMKEGKNSSYICDGTMIVNIIAVTMTARNGRVTRLEHVFLRGGQIKFIVVPELLKSAPIFKKVQALRAKSVGDGSGAGRGRGKKKN